MKARYLFGLAVTFAVLAIMGLRSNSQRSLELTNQIISKDLASQSTKAEVNELREFVFAHMNSSAEFELTGAYERAVTNARQAGVTDALYASAQASCDREGVSSVAQAACVQDYLNRRLGNEQKTKLPLRSQYKYAFAAPNWSADLAGWGLLGSVGFLLAATVIYIVGQFKFRLGG